MTLFVLAFAFLTAAFCLARQMLDPQMLKPIYASSAASSESPPDLAPLGKEIFFDPSLSASGRISCATCHSPSHAYAAPNGLAVQLGGPHVDQQGLRAVPSLRYVLNRTPKWNKPFVENIAERLREGEEPASGGFGWDGRFSTLNEQAMFPLLAPNEMANASLLEIVVKLRSAAYADSFRKIFGAQIFDDPKKACVAMLAAIERFELDDPSFHPYTSKYDDYLDGKAQLTAQEQHGLDLFNDPKRGNCAVCHLDQKGTNGAHPLFTDYQFEALGVPRNQEILANASPIFFDAGLCGPLRTDQAGQPKSCGMFKTPTLRNVATRRVFFHNGRFHSLKEALRFYVERDTDTRTWYPVSASGAVTKFDDLPPEQRANVDVIDEPLTRKEGDSPAWNEAEIDDVMAFLETLTDRDVEPILH